MAACTLFAPPSIARPTVVYLPDLVGRISEMSHDGQTNTYTVTVDGERLQIGPDVRGLRGSPGTNDSLLLYGTDDGVAWYASIGIATIEPWDRCALLSQADSWADDIPLGPDGVYPTYYAWCLDSRGRVVSARPAGGV